MKIQQEKGLSRRRDAGGDLAWSKIWPGPIEIAKSFCRRQTSKRKRKISGASLHSVAFILCTYIYVSVYTLVRLLFLFFSPPFLSRIAAEDISYFFI